MQFPDELHLRVTAAGKPVPKALVLARIIMLHKNHYSVIAGPTNKDGICSITRKEMLEQCKAELAIAIMDYTDPEKDNAGQIKVNVMSPNELIGAQKAYALYKGAYPYPKGYDKTLKQAYQSVLHVAPNGLTVEATSVGSNMAISSTVVIP